MTPTAWISGSAGLLGPSPVAPPTLAAAPSLDALMPMLAVLGIALAVSLILTPVMRRIALASGIVDWPDAKRKAHAKPVAYLGGVAIFLGWLAGVVYFILMLAPDVFGAAVTLPEGVPEFPRESFPLSIVAGALAILITGLFDDVYGISARVKIGGQLFAAAAIASEDVGTHLVDQTFLLLGMAEILPAWAPYWLGTAAIAGLIIGGCNALNLVDGLDGLASGITGIAAIGLGIIAILFITTSGYADATPRGIIPLIMCLAMLGAVLGFLPYNFNPASIFMGDTGSLLLGYLTVTTILMFGDCRGWAPIMFSAGIVCFALPITDTALSIVRRKLQGRPIFAPDAMHIHHMLRRSGLSVKQAVLTMYTIAFVFAALGVTTTALRLPWKLAMALFVALVALIMVVGYRTSRRLSADDKAAAATPAEAPAPGEEHGGHGTTHPTLGSAVDPDATPSPTLPPR
ncbi:MraY family glycosyltransferase [Phycisphaeraceae bacterium D3-23]